MSLRIWLIYTIKTKLSTSPSLFSFSCSHQSNLSSKEIKSFHIIIPQKKLKTTTNKKKKTSLFFFLFTIFVVVYSLLSILLANISAHCVLYSPVPQCRLKFVGKGGMRQAGSRLLQFVQVVVQGWDALLETLTFACLCDNSTRLGCRVHWVSREDLPMVEHALWEGLATSVGTKVSCETWGRTEQSMF